MTDLERAVEHLASQFERALPVLFTGAGFSLGAKTIDGVPLPSADTLKCALWTRCFPGDAYEPSASFQNLYESALRLHRIKTGELLRQSLTVDAESLPAWYEPYFAMPWERIFTLNIDDLPRAASRRFTLPRSVRLISALRENQIYEPSGAALEIVQLNGDIDGVPDLVTFSTSQYAERLARPDPWYVQLAAALVSRPFVFLGTQLDEPPLWQHIELRRQRGGRGLRELRPRSYLVTPTLDPVRRSLLAEYNVTWLPFTAEQFHAEILSKLTEAGRMGLSVLRQQASISPFESRSVPLVSGLAINPIQTSNFLLGEQPRWADLQAGRAFVRESDRKLWDDVAKLKAASGVRGLAVISGTAGSGKSTALMRVVLQLTAEGENVGWVDAEGNLSPYEIRTSMRRSDAPTYLGIDDADMYGSELSSMVYELCSRPPFPLILAGIRSGRVDTVVHQKLLRDIPLSEFVMPPLTDSDIDGLIGVLAAENRLGLLRGQTRDQQRESLRDQAGRQLLVAMIQATSGRKFEEKAMEELLELDEAARPYGLIAVATAYRFGLQRSEILLGLGESSNAILNSVDRLVRRHVVRVGHDGAIWARHRVIAEVIASELQKTGQIKELLHGLAHVAATQVTQNLPRSARPWRLLRYVINHDFLIRVIGVDSARGLYGDLEMLLRWDYHFWLQRGSLEVEVGDLALAENFLNQARGLAPSDTYVETEYSYLLFRKAIDNPTSAVAPKLAEEATGALTSLIDRIGERDSYPYHVLGSQGISWARRGITSSIEKDRFIRSLIYHLGEGCRNHPRATALKKLLDDLKREKLEIATPTQRSLSDMQ